MADMVKLKKPLILALILTSSMSYAESATVEFFVSNNTKEIDLATAYQRLTSKQQNKLENSIINVMQQNHIEQGKLKNMLGSYQMSDQTITADNSQRFITSPYQEISSQQAFTIAKQLAVALDQESIAVNLPNAVNVDDITLTFTDYEPSLSEINQLISQKLPASYRQAYSLQLDDTSQDFNAAKVKKVEWLGSKINLDEVKHAFPAEKINYKTGRSYLVYQNGRVEEI